MSVRRLPVLLAVLVLLVAACPALAGTVTVVTSAEGAMTNTCAYGTPVDPLWPVIVQASTGPASCDLRIPFAVVPPARVADIVTASGTARLFGVSGLELGLLAAADAVVGDVPVPAGDATTTTAQPTPGLATSAGVVTVVLRAPNGTGEVWLASPGSRSVAVSVRDVTRPVLLGPTATMPANAPVGYRSTLGVRFTDNGPSVGGTRASVDWGDGSSSAIATVTPAAPFTPAIQSTKPASKLFSVPGTFTVRATVVDDAKNAGRVVLGTLRVWAAPSAVRRPAIVGRLRLGTLLSCHAGTWRSVGGAHPLVHRWLRNGNAIARGTGRVYRLGAADRNRRIGCAVTGSNPAGLSATAGAVARRFWVAPRVRVGPRVRGRARAGATVTCTTGSWRWSPRTYLYAWLRDGAAIRGRRSRRLHLSASDVGTRIACRVTAVNPAGRASATSAAVVVHARPAPPSGGGGGEGGGSACDPSYPDVCIPPPPPDLDCGDIPYRNFRVIGADPHGFDGDRDGIGCET